MVSITGPVRKARKLWDDAIFKTISKFGFPGANAGVQYNHDDPEPPYERQVPPKWLYRMRRKQSLINNSIEEKVNQTFRREFTEPTEEYVARCPECHETFETAEAFREQLGEDGEDLSDDDIDFSKPRPCPVCDDDELHEFHTPDPLQRDRLETFLEQANHRGRKDQFLEGDRQNSVGQTFLDVCKEVAWDIQSFDDGWMIFERDYTLNPYGEIIDWDLQAVHRAAPEVMRYSTDDEGNKGGKWWCCPKCRATKETYQPQRTGEDCEECGAKTYRVYAEMLKEPGGEPVEWYIRGEFAHGSEYEPSKFYGFSPIITLWEESRTIEQMDKWYKESYEQRRAPRGAMVVRSTNAESVRSWNTQQMELLKTDPQHIPTFIDDTDGQAQPLTWQPLLDEPAQMQHMQMREWFLERISAKYGVTAIFQTGSPSNSGLSQSMEIIVSNRSAMRLKNVFDEVFIPAFLSQLQIEGWEIEVSEPEEEDELAEAERIGKELQNAQMAQQVGAPVEWTPENNADIKPGMLEPPEEEEEGGMGGMMGGMGMGGGDEGGDDPFSGVMGGGSGGMGGRPPEANTTGGEPASPGEPTQDNPIEAQDDAVTTGDSGYGNAQYGGRRGGVINVFEDLEEELDKTEDPEMRKRLFGQAKKAFDLNYKRHGVDASAIERYAQDDEYTFADLAKDHRGRWLTAKTSRDAVESLYELLGGDPQR